MRRANLLVSRTLAELSKSIRPGRTTKELDRVAEDFIRSHGAVPAFKGYPNPCGEDFPASICTSVNEVVVHGIPGDTPLQEGDIVSIDCGVELEGFYGDSCYTFCVGEVSAEKEALLAATKAALYKGIGQALPGHRLGDVGEAIQQHCEGLGYGVVHEFVGHGIGRSMHEEPQIPNYGTRGRGVQLKNGMCLAIEPMITMGKPDIGLLPDRWGAVTLDGRPAAHFEHTVALHHGRVDILSSFELIEEQLQKNG